jgi:hypothetical protein
LGFRQGQHGREDGQTSWSGASSLQGERTSVIGTSATSADEQWATAFGPEADMKRT